VHTCWWGNVQESVCFKDLGTAGRIILQWIFKKGMRDMDWLKIGTGERLL